MRSDIRIILILMALWGMGGSLSAASAQTGVELQARTFYDDGRYPQARAAQEKALDELKKQYGPQHPRTADGLFWLARIASAQRQDQEAAKLHFQALEIRQKTLGASHPDVAVSLTRIAALLVLGGQFDRAEPLLKSALATLEAKLGPAHIEVANTLDILSWLYQTTARFDEAEKANARAVAVAEKALPANHPDLATKLSNYGALKQSRGQLQDARAITAKALKIRETALRPDHPDLAESLHNLALIEQSLGLQDNVEARFIQAIAIWRKEYGPAHPLVATGLSNLGVVYMEAGKYASAEPVYKESLALAETRVGKEHADVADANNNLGLLYLNMGRHTESEPRLQTALRISLKTFGAAHPRVAQITNNLGNLYQAQARYKEAQTFYEQSLASKEKVFGAQSAEVATGLQNLAITYHSQAKPEKAEALYRRALAIVEKTNGSEHPTVAAVTQNFGGLLEEQGRYAEAGPLLLRSVAIREKSLGENHPDLGESLNNLAKLYLSMGRYKETLALTKRAVNIWKKSLGPEHPLAGRGMQSLGAMLLAERRYDDALPFLRQALAIREKALGATHPEVAESLATLGSVLGTTGQLDEAERHLRRALAIRQEKLPAGHPDIASSLSALADLLVTKRLFPEAKQYHTRALDMRRGALGADHPAVALSRNSLALISLRTNRTADGLAEARRATSVLTAHSKREAARGAAIDAADAGVLDGRSLDFRVHLLALQQALGEGLIADKDAAAEAFITGQWTIRTAAGKALSQLALRAAGSSPELQELVRRRQDHASDWKLLGHELVTLASAETAGDRAQQVAAKKAQRDSLEREIGALDGEISERFPDFAALSDASPLSVERVQQRLRDDEALVQFLTGSEQTHVWVVSKRAVTWRTLPVREADLDTSVQRLRCGLDVSEWTRENTACAALIRNYSVADANSGKPLPFDGAEAHNLYRTLFGEVARDISGRHLIVVPTGALARFPMQVLVTEKPANGAAFKDWQWLGAAQPLTVLPSVASLEPLRAGSKNAVAQKPFLGFGNPLLTGANGTDRRAFDIMACRDGKPQFIAAGDRQSDARGLAVAPRPDDFSDIIRRQAPLPETADELCRVASVLGADNAAVKLGKDATESEVKRLSGNGQISEYSVLHFATHGLKAGDLAFMQEPSLLMTPPQTGDGADDGLLTASEIARLKLNSDFIVLSACNTAAGQNAETEALSGLARAFLYAGSRGMLVSHWPVNSQAAVEIVTRLFAISVNASDKSRAEAMRTVLSGLARSAQPARSHPSYWAPFVMLGAF